MTTSPVIVRVALPQHLRRLARVDGEVQIRVTGTTLGALLDALEAAHPVLRGTTRDHDTLRRRAFVRFHAGGEDLSLDGPDTLLPPVVISGAEAFRVVGAMAGG